MMNESVYLCESHGCLAEATTERKLGPAVAEYCSRHAADFDVFLARRRQTQVRAALR